MSIRLFCETLISEVLKIPAASWRSSKSPLFFPLVNYWRRKIHTEPKSNFLSKILLLTNITFIARHILICHFAPILVWLFWSILIWHIGPTLIWHLLFKLLWHIFTHITLTFFIHITLTFFIHITLTFFHPYYFDIFSSILLWHFGLFKFDILDPYQFNFFDPH